MRLVLDTNVAIAGLLWDGPPHRLLELAIDERVALYSSPALLDELARTLRYPKFAKRIEQATTTPSALTDRYGALVALVTPTQVPRVVPGDIDDDQVVACALAAQAELIVSGDKAHLIPLGTVPSRASASSRLPRRSASSDFHKASWQPCPGLRPTGLHPGYACYERYGLS